jgi:uncharacterized protein
MKQLVEMLVKALVDNPDKVDIREITGEKNVMFEVRVSEEDVGKVIGKSGKTINALRTIMRAATSKENKKVIVEIIQ